MTFDLMTLPNGLRVVGEKMDHVRSVSVGLWIGTGSQHELNGEEGLSHFLEHMVFKGTESRSARQIAEEMDAVGGQLNAFTGKECTCFYAKTMDENIDLAVDIVSDLVRRPVFDPVEFEKEKGVVLEEIDMTEDTPEDVSYDLLMQAHFGVQGVSKPILGTEEGIRAYSRDELAAYHAAMYHPQNAVFSIAGNYDMERVAALLEKYLADWAPEGMRPHGCKVDAHAPTCLFKEKDIEQVHISLGFPGLKIGDKDTYALAIFNSAYGGAMSSRLFQKIREESGMAYTVYSCPNAYTDCGVISVYAATNPDTAPAVYDMILAETEKIAAEGLTRKEFEMSREQLKAGYILGGETTSSRMQGNGRRMLLQNKTRTEDEVIDVINAIDYDEVNALMRRLLTAPHSLSLVGRGVDKLAKKIYKQ